MKDHTTSPSEAKTPGKFQHATSRATIAVAGIGALILALASVLDGFDKLVVAAQQLCSTLSRPGPTDASTPPSTTAPPQAPQSAAVVQERPRPSHGAERRVGTLFVAGPPGDDGALIGVHVRRVLTQEGFSLVGDRGAANLVIEIGSPAFGTPRTLPSSGLAITGVAAVLQATISPGAGGAPVAPPQQREVMGRGDGEEAARRDAISRAADQLSERIAAVLRENSASSGPRQ